METLVIKKETKTETPSMYDKIKVQVKRDVSIEFICDEMDIQLRELLKYSTRTKKTEDVQHYESVRKKFNENNVKLSEILKSVQVVGMPQSYLQSLANVETYAKEVAAEQAKAAEEAKKKQEKKAS